MYATMSESNNTVYVKNSTFSILLITFNVSSVLIVFCQFFAWIALDNVDLYFSLILVTEANAIEGELHQPCNCITNAVNPYL
jgi:hypothetical protein